ncbi:MAG: hypothetical protein AAGU14_06520 [Eubacteriaceae bacterium]
MYNKAISKKVVTVIGAAAMVIIILLVLMIYSILKDMKMTRLSIALDEAHVQAVTEAGFTKGEDGFAYYKNDIIMSFQINTKGDKQYDFPYVSMVFANSSENIQSEILIYDARNKLYKYTQVDASGKKYELTLNENLEVSEVKVPGKNDQTDTSKHNELRNAIIDRLQKFYNTFGFSAENALGFNCPQEVSNGAAANTTFGMGYITKFCTKSDQGYKYSSQDEKLQLLVFPDGGESYDYPYMTVIDKTLNVNTTFVPQTNTILCNYAQGETLINVAYDIKSETIVLYKEGGLNKTEKYANDAVTKSKIKNIYETEIKNIQDIFKLSPDLLLRHNQPFDFSALQQQNTNTITDQTTTDQTTDQTTQLPSSVEEQNRLDSENP